VNARASITSSLREIAIHVKVSGKDGEQMSMRGDRFVSSLSVPVSVITSLPLSHVVHGMLVCAVFSLQ